MSDCSLVMVRRSAYLSLLSDPNHAPGSDEMTLAALRLPPAERSSAHLASLLIWSREHVKLGTKVRIEQLCKVMELVDLEEEEVLFRQGDEGDAYYLVFSGEVGLSLTDRNRPGISGRRHPGASMSSSAEEGAR